MVKYRSSIFFLLVVTTIFAMSADFLQSAYAPPRKESFFDERFLEIQITEIENEINRNLKELFRIFPQIREKLEIVLNGGLDVDDQNTFESESLTDQEIFLEEQIGMLKDKDQLEQLYKKLERLKERLKNKRGQDQPSIMSVAQERQKVSRNVPTCSLYQ